MMEVTRLKKSKKIVHVLGPASTDYTWVVIPLDEQSRKGNRGDVCKVRNSNLVTDREAL